MSEDLKMPWTMSDASRHTKKATSPAAKQQWASTANAVLKSSAGDEGKAVRIANAAVAKRKGKKGPKAKGAGMPAQRKAPKGSGY